MGAYQQRRRAAEKASGEKGIDRIGVAMRDGWICGICHCPIARPEDATVDHIVPLSLGGAHTWDNVQAAHRFCNSRKDNPKHWVSKAQRAARKRKKGA